MYLKNALKKYPVLKRVYRLLHDLSKKDPRYFFFSVNTARKRACTLETNMVFPRVAETRRTLGASEITMLENLVAIPLRDGKSRDYSGGLISLATGDLVEEAIHIRQLNKSAVLSQEISFPAVQELHCDSLPEIKSLVIYGGLLFEHFGHFLLESLGRLWAYEKVRHLDPYIFFLLSYDPPEYLATSNFAYQIFKGFDIPLDKILFVKEPTRIRSVIVPSQKYGTAQLLRPGTDFIEFVRKFRFPVQSPTDFQNADKIYVSRSRLVPGNGRVVGEKLFEEYLANQGYAIFHPQEHSVYQQLSVYCNASKIIFLDGSALHSCILLPDLVAQVCVIARRTDTQYDLSEIIDQFRGYGQRVKWIDCVEDQYQFGMESWQALALVNWSQVSKRLLFTGFVNETMNDIPESELQEILKIDIREHVKAIANEPAFVRYMADKTRSMEA